MPLLDESRRTAVRICHHAGGADKFGTGVFITPTTILTARHVVDPLKRYASDTPLGPDVLHVETLASHARPLVETVHFPTAPDIDLALALLAPANSAAPASCLALHPPGAVAFSVGDELTIMGFSSPNGAIQTDRFTVLGGHPNAGCHIINRAVPEGYSGGPVLAGGALTGVVYARHQPQGQSYFYGLEHVHALLASAGVEPVWSAAALPALRRYPLGPLVSRNTVHTMLYALIRAFIMLYEGHDAKSIVFQANAARQQCGPDNETRGVIDVAQLPNPQIDLVGFWYGAFSQAGLQSPRMLAALILTTSEEQLPPAARTERAGLLTKLAAWPS